MKKALIESGIYILLAIILGLGIYWYLGEELGSQYFMAYILEKSLSVDNLFVMYLIFNHFVTPKNIQHHCLFWGIIGVIIMRGICIFGGVALLNWCHWLIYPLGLILIYSGAKIFKHSEDEEIEIHENKVVKFFKKHFNFHDKYIADKFFYQGQATALFIVLLMIETTDIVFAMDSIPASLAISQNGFIIFTANLMAVLGLRALYFVLAEAVDILWGLKFGVACVLVFIGIKMLIAPWFHIPTTGALGIVFGTLFLSVFYSLLVQKKN